MQVTITVNGVEHTDEVEPRLLLVHFLRDTLRLTGTHWGCDTSQCGTCVAVARRGAGQDLHGAGRDGRRAPGPHRRGAGDGGKLDPVQEGFMSEHGLQCGFCTPG